MIWFVKPCPRREAGSFRKAARQQRRKGAAKTQWLAKPQRFAARRAATASYWVISWALRLRGRRLSSLESRL
jgi:hypothetical protein